MVQSNFVAFSEHMNFIPMGLAVKFPKSVEMNLYEVKYWKLSVLLKKRASFFYNNIEFSYDNTMCVYLWKQVSQHKGVGLSQSWRDFYIWRNNTAN